MEGPGLVVLKEKVQKFCGKKIISAYGTQKIDMERLSGQKVTDIATWGKHLLILLDDCTIRVHYLMFGNYFIDSRHPEKEPKLSLELTNGEWNNYNCAAKIIEGTEIEKLYDWSTDVMSEKWKASVVKDKLKTSGSLLVCDLLLNQDIFTGVGNVIKNETLFRIKLHPESKVADLSNKQTVALIKETREYSFDFYRWEKEGVRRKKYCVHRRAWCPDCGTRISKSFTGSTPRSSFWCPQCQPLLVKR